MQHDPIPQVEAGEQNAQNLQIQLQLQQAVREQQNELDNQLMPEDNEILEAMVADNFQLNQTQQVGYAMIRMEDSDPAWSQALNAEATRLWARFFYPGKPSHLQVSIPAEWASFFYSATPRF